MPSISSKPRVRKLVPSLGVSDMQRSLAFYSDYFGFEVVDSFENEDGETLWCWLRAGVGELMLQQLDNERQTATKERRQQNDEVERARKDAATAREAFIALREDCAQLKAESGKASEKLTAATAAMETLRSSLEKAEAQLSASERDLAVARVRHEVADQLRQEATVRLNVQAEEIGQLRQEIANLRRRSVKSRAPEESALRSKEETDAKRANND